MEDNKKEFDLSRLENVTASKVYVTKDGNAYEWSFNAPAHIANAENSIFDGQFTAESFLSVFNCIPEVFAPVNEIAQRVAGLNFVLKRFDNDEVIWDNKKFNDLFNRPNPFQTMREHIWASMVYKIVTGASFQYVNRPTIKSLNQDYNSVKTLVNIPTTKVKVTLDDLCDIYTSDSLTDAFKSIYIEKPKGGKRDFDLQNIITIANFDISGGKLNNWTSELQGATAAIKNIIPVYLARNEIYVKRGALGFVVSKKTDASGTVALSPKEKQNLNNDFLQSYGITGQSALYPIASQPVDFVRTSASIQELQPFDETAQDARSIYAVLRVPKHLCPTKENSTFNNADADLKTFYLDVILPYGQLYANVLTTGLNFDKAGFYIDIDTSKVSVLEENKKDRAEANRTDGEVFEKRFKNGVCTLNDWIVGTGGEKSSNPIYDKLLFDMQPAELELINNILNNKATVNNG